MYQDLRGSKELMEWKKVFMDNHALPRAKFTLWLLLNGRLPINDKLQKFGLIDS